MGLPAPELVTLDVAPGAALESQSGLQQLRPRIFGALHRAEGPRRVAAIVMHPTSNFMGHYLLQPLAARGVTCLGLNSRYAGNDTLPGGEPAGLSPQDLPPVQGLALCAAHEGRSHLMRHWIDPSVFDEDDPLSANFDLDMYDERNGPPYAPAFLERYRAAQLARLERIETWVRERLALLRRLKLPGAPRDQVFVIHRTHADPRFLDLALDANDRAVGSVWAAGAQGARAVNAAASQMGRVTSLAAFLSQWSPSSRADGPANLARTRVPVLLHTYTADQSTFPSTRDAWLAAGGDRIRNVDVRGGTHYLAGQPDLLAQVADEMAQWMRAL